MGSKIVQSEVKAVTYMSQHWNDETLGAVSLLLKDLLRQRSGKIKAWHHRCYACGNPRMVWLRKVSLWHCYACGKEEEGEEKIIATVTLEK